MGEYTQIRGVKTWYDEFGTGPPVVLLHGGLCTNETWGPQISDLAERFHLYAPERRAHGHTPDVAGPLSYEEMAEDTIAFLQQVVGERAHLVGFSDGGIVGLLVAIARPDLVDKLVSMSANFDTDGMRPEVAAMSASMTPDAESFAPLRAMYGAVSPDGPEHWPVVFGKMTAMFSSQPHISPSDLGRIEAPTLILSGDDDMVALEHTIELYRSISNAELAVVPGTSHLAAMEKPALVNRLAIDFLANDPDPTMMPISRAAMAYEQRR